MDNKFIGGLFDFTPELNAKIGLKPRAQKLVEERNSQSFLGSESSDESIFFSKREKQDSKKTVHVDYLYDLPLFTIDVKIIKKRGRTIY